MSSAKQKKPNNLDIKKGTLNDHLIYLWPMSHDIFFKYGNPNRNDNLPEIIDKICQEN